MMSASTTAAAGRPTILVLGDSLSAAHGIDSASGWVTLLQSRLQREGYPQRVVNASISGDTTAGGLNRLPAALAAHRPDILILELGANDGLRGMALGQVRRNLAQMVELGQKAGSRVLLLGILIPPNFGPVYTAEFRRMYQDIADEYRLPLLPFLLEGVADDPELMQSDGLHPNARAQPRILENVWPLLSRCCARRQPDAGHLLRAMGKDQGSSSK
jgi:acyl-CoA thioesterase-1